MFVNLYLMEYAKSKLNIVHPVFCHVCFLGCSLLYLFLRHPPPQSGGHHPGEEPVWAAQLPLQGERCPKAHPREEMVTEFNTVS